MAKIKYKSILFSGDRARMIKQACRLVEVYQAQGYRLTTRQLYYRFVANDLFPNDRKYVLVGKKWVRDPDGTKNAEPNYKWLGDLISDGRMSGLVDWTAIEDRTRELNAVSHWDHPRGILESCQRSFRLDKWAGQPCRVEVWVEKDALEGVVQRAAHAMDVAAFSCRGYTSMSSMWEAAQRLKGYIDDRQQPIILHLGDHDPSGIDMTRDIRDRLNNFIAHDWAMEHDDSDVERALDEMEEHCGGRGVTVKRIALNMDQVKKYAPPPNPAKTTPVINPIPMNSGRRVGNWTRWNPRCLTPSSPTTFPNLSTRTRTKRRKNKKINTGRISAKRRGIGTARWLKRWRESNNQTLAGIKYKPQ